MWVEFPDDQHEIFVNVSGEGGNFSGFLLTLGLNVIEISFINADNTQIGAATLSVSGVQPGQWSNFVISADTATQQIQVSVSGATTEFTSLRWNSNNPMTNGNAALILISSSETATDIEFCAANFYLASPQVFYDLTDPANLQKFISNSGEPVDMGPNGQNPTGSTPSVFLSVPMGEPINATTVFANLGTSGPLAQQDTEEDNGQTFTYAPTPIVACAPWPRPAVTLNVTTAISLPCNPCCSLPTKLPF
jgi:hypothetical protein